MCTPHHNYSRENCPGRPPHSSSFSFVFYNGKTSMVLRTVRNKSRVCSVRNPHSRYRYGFRTELTEVSGTGIHVVPNLPKCPVPALMYRNYRSVRYRYESLYRYRQYRYPCRTEVTEVSGTGIDVPNLSKCPVLVLMSYRIYRNVRYRY